MSTISYNKLSHLLIDKGMSKGELRQKAGLSTSVIAKLGKGENLNTDSLVKICDALDCGLEDIMELVRE